MDKDTSIILNWLRDPPQGAPMSNEVTCEYRLVCSGELYNSDVQIFDWSKSELARYIFGTPFQLYAIDRRLATHESALQELRLVFRCRLLTKRREKSSVVFHPHAEIARDLSALLTLYLRRLVSVYAPVREVHHDQTMPADMREVAFPIYSQKTAWTWPRHPASVCYGPSGIERIVDYNPPPLAVSSGDVESFFATLPSLEACNAAILAARLYHAALEHLYERPDVSYLTLVFATETLAGRAMRHIVVDDAKKIQHKKSVQDLAQEYGLNEDQARNLAVEACKGMTWARDKFFQFVTQNISSDFWDQADELFNVPPFVLPDRNSLGDVLKAVLRVRDEFVHGGKPYPASIAFGLGPRVSVHAVEEVMGKKPDLPPVVWFERLANNVIRNFLRAGTSTGQRLSGAT